MKNYELLQTTDKPAPGELVILQGFVNTLNIEKGTDDIDTEDLLKSWLDRHGLLQDDIELTSKDLDTALSFRETIRSLLMANSGEKIETDLLNQINNMISQLKLGVRFDTYGNISILPDNYGFAGACEKILAIIVISISNGTWFRLKVCSASNCKWAFYDSSKNQSGRWCSMSVCGSREKARAYRKRQSPL